MKIFNLLVLLALLITAYGGFKNGFIQTVFKTIGYIAGGVAGVAIAVEVMSTWSSNLAKATGAIILILLLATMGEFVLGKIGLGFRKVLFISPLKLLGIDVDEKNADSGPNFIKSHGMSWPHLEDTDSRSKLVFGPGVPVTYFLDKSGEVIHKHIGAYRSKSQLYEAVEKYFEVKL